MKTEGNIAGLLGLLFGLMLFVIINSLAGCSALVPNDIHPEFVHMSHATQHNRPDGEICGAEILQVSARWGHRSGPFLELAEGISLDKKTVYTDSIDTYGEIQGPREQFTLRVGYTFHIKD